MNTLLKNMMLTLLALGIGQAAWADDTLNVGGVAQKEMLQLAEAGDAELQLALGVMYEQGKGIRQDYTEAVRWYRKAAEEQGFAVAQYNLGRMYEQGKGVRQDYAEAAGWFRKAAELGLAAAQYNLAVMYTEGRGVRQDYEEAVRWVSEGRRSRVCGSPK